MYWKIFFIFLFFFNQSGLYKRKQANKTRKATKQENNEEGRANAVSLRDLCSEVRNGLVLDLVKQKVVRSLQLCRAGPKLLPWERLKRWVPIPEQTLKSYKLLWSKEAERGSEKKPQKVIKRKEREKEE